MEAGGLLEAFPLGAALAAESSGSKAHSALKPLQFYNQIPLCVNSFALALILDITPQRYF